MDRIMGRKLALAAGGAALLLTLGACEKKVGGQVVAVVNGEEITQQQLNAELGNTQLPPGADKQKVMAQLLQRIVERQLVVGRAKAEKLDQAPTYLAQVRRAQDEILVGMLAQKLAKAQPLPDAGAVDRFIAGNPTLFAGRKKYALDQIVFPVTRDQALIGKLREAHTLEAVAAALSGAGVQFARSNTVVDTAALPPEIGARIAALPPGEPFLVPQGQQLVINVIRAAEATPTPAAQARPIATELIRRQKTGEAMAKAVADERAKAKIDYQPGFAPPPPGAAGAAGAAKPAGTL